MIERLPKMRSCRQDLDGIEGRPDDHQTDRGARVRRAAADMEAPLARGRDLPLQAAAVLLQRRRPGIKQPELSM